MRNICNPGASSVPVPDATDKKDHDAVIPVPESLINEVISFRVKLGSLAVMSESKKLTERAVSR